MEVEINRDARFTPIGKNKNKKQIILTHTSREAVSYINSLRYRYNGNNDSIPHYLITKTGDIHELISPNTYSNFFSKSKINKRGIIISIENLGWLKKKSLNNGYVNWIGDIYKQEVFEKKWRDYIFWDKYTDDQIDSLSNLLIKLNEDFEIPLISYGHNVKMDDVEMYEGIVSLSNYYDYETSVSPAFDFDKLFKKIENEQPAR